MSRHSQLDQAVLDVELFKPYNALIHSVSLTSNVTLIEVVPDELVAVLPNLEALTFDQANQLRELPASVSGLTKLRELHLTTEEDTPISSLPLDLGTCPALHSITLNRACLTQLPASLCGSRTCQQLAFRSNGLRQLPEQLGDMQQLTHLMVSFNPLRSLPDSATALCRLTDLSLAGQSTHTDLSVSSQTSQCQLTVL